MNTSPSRALAGRFGLLRETLGAAAALSTAVVVTGLLFIAFFSMTAGCASDEPVGSTRTVEKRTVETPTEKTTITEVREKDTEIVR